MTAEPLSAPDLTDAGLLALYAQGDASAAAMLTARLLPRVLGQAVRMLADRTEAEDVAQEAMMRLWRIAPEWREGEAQVTTWLYRVTANLCTDRLRKRRRTTPLDTVADPVDLTPGAAETLQQNSRMRALSDALATLPDRQAQAVALRHLEGLSNPDIAATMDLSVRSVESLIARGKRALTAVLADRREELGYRDD